MARGRVQRKPLKSPSKRSQTNQSRQTTRSQSGFLAPDPGNPPHNNAPLPTSQPLREVHIALDTGTERTKASFLLKYVDNEGHELPSSKLETVLWRNYESSIPTQVAFGDNGQMFYGEKVDEELKNGGIKQSQVIRLLKPALFDAHTPSPRAPKKEQLRRLTEKRKAELTETLASCGEDIDGYRLEDISIYSDYMGLVYRYVLSFIARTHGSLRWLSHDNPELSKDWSPPGNVKIRVSLPVPVGSTQKQVQLVVAAAKAAGIPNPYPVAEPASALIHHLSNSRGQSIIGKTFLILDVGAGSADQQVWTVVNENPLQVREAIIPERVKTDWCGGAYINKTAVQLIMNEIRDVDRVLEALRRHDSPISDKQSLEWKLAKKFEKAKRRFGGQETLYLRIPGLPDIPEFGLCGGNCVVLEPKDVKDTFAPCLRIITSMLDTAIKSLERHTSWGTTEQGIHEIIVVGGVSQNRYFLQQIHNRYSGGLQSPFRYSIPVTIPPDAVSGSLTVSYGAVLLSAEKDLIKERYVRRSFCVAQHEEVNLRQYPAKSWYKSPHDGRTRVNVTHFLLQQGLYAQRFSCEPFQGWRGLLANEIEANGTWLIQEQLYYSDTLSENGLWIDDPSLDVHAMPMLLSIHISWEEAQQFPHKLTANNVEWYCFDYELVLTLDGHIMTFEFIIPRKGKFPKRGDRHADVMYKTGHYDTAGVSQLFSSA